MRASPQQKALTKRQEGLRLDAYLDTQDPPIWTIGYGHAATNPVLVRGLINGEFYQGRPCKGLKITQAEADRLFDEDADESERGISAAITVDLTQAQFDALFDFAHHYGLERFLQSTLLQKINFNPNNLEAILPQFQRWNINAGEPDKAMYMRACRRACGYANAPIPQLLWEPKRFPWSVANGKIDFGVVPTAAELANIGRAKAAPYKFDPDKIVIPKPEEAPPLDLGPLDIALPNDLRAAPDVATQEAEAPAPVEHASPPVAGVSPDPTPIPPSLQREPAAAEALPSGPPPQVVPLPKPPPVPVPIGKQTGAVDAADNSREWSHGAKSMLLSRRFYGLALVMFGRLWTLKSGSTAVLSAVSDPLVVEMVSGFGVMLAGEVLQWWGERRATRPLK